MSSDPQLDALLRDVPLPGGFVARVQSSLGPTDEELDAALRQMLIPIGLLRDLCAIPADELLDEQLCDVAAPLEMVRQAQHRSWTSGIRSAASRAAELAVALSLFLSVSAALFGAIAVLIGSIYPHALPPDEPAFVIAANLPLDFQSPPADDDEQTVLELPVSIEIRPLPSAVAGRDAFDVDPPDLPSDRADGPVGQWLNALAEGVHPLDNVVLMRFGVFGYPQYGEEVTPPLVSPPSPIAAGIELPPVRGYDRLFVVKHGVFPPVRPAAHPALATIALPLRTQTASYQNVQSLLRQKRLPAASQVRTEDFLAAMGYDFPPASPGDLAIRTAAGPSVFGPAGTGLLQLAAVAGPLSRSELDGGHLVLAIDMSQSMARGERLNLVRQSIDQVLARMGPHDRLSLVVFDEVVRYVVERATTADADDLRLMLSKLRPAGATDLAEGLQQAAAIAMTGEAGQTRPSRMVLITDSHVAMPPVTQSLVSAVLSIAEESGVRMDVFEVGDHLDEDPVLADWARMMHGTVRRPESADDAAWMLVERLYGKSPVIGEDARLTLRLDPRAVAAYRLVGQEGNSLSSLRPAALEVDLHASEVATALLEIWFQASDADDVGEVELVWRDPATGQPRLNRQRISRLQFAPTWEQAPLSLQQAAIAAETAEVLRGSRQALREVGLVPQGSGDLAGVIETAGRVHPRLAERPEFRQWVRMLGDMSKIRP
ncbi:MAG TPA: VWA domain-containing protein [Pirellulaceae bacterium]|nr:VWA domain-containing protein [Pirellulaceae bacterium]